PRVRQFDDDLVHGIAPLANRRNASAHARRWIAGRGTGRALIATSSIVRRHGWTCTIRRHHRAAACDFRVVDVDRGTGPVRPTRMMRGTRPVTIATVE